MKIRLRRYALALCILISPLALPRSWAAEADARSQRQEAFRQWRYGLFLHFNMSTFTGSDWANGYEDPGAFAPARLDCGQWAETAQAAGMTYAVLTVKHTGGWCLWPSATTKHGVQSFHNFRNGQADLVGEFVAAFRARGLKVGLYYCFPGDYAGRFGNTLPAGRPDLHGLPPEAAGDRVGFIKRQLHELLTRYQPDLLWIDQYSNPYTAKQWPELKAFIHQIAPRCVVIANNAHDLENSDALSYEWPWDAQNRPGNVHGRPGFVGTLPPEGNTAPAELCDTIQTQSRWFWNPDIGPDGLQAAEQMAATYRQCRERNANYLLNVPPDRDGQISAAYVQRLRELGDLIRRPTAGHP